MAQCTVVPVSFMDPFEDSKEYPCVIIDGRKTL